MANYVIGDIQGCYQTLQKLLSAINFSDTNDTLWTVGDLVNRGPNSLAVVEFFMQLTNKPIIVLGNHDLHFLAVALGTCKKNKSDTLESLLDSPNLKQIIAWYCQQPLAHFDKHFNCLIVHAGLPNIWSLDNCLEYAAEVERVLADPELRLSYFHNMYGDEPGLWNEQNKNIAGTDRLRLITNYLTRMRMCYPDGRLCLKHKGAIADAPDDLNLKPWFELEQNQQRDFDIIFGHWAALEGHQSNNLCHNLFGLDTGCVWGSKLTALRLEDKKLFSVASVE